MPRKTRRVGKKNKNTTHKKRKYVIRKYKFLRGGLGENDYAKIGINNKFSFGNPDNLDYEKIEEFKKYVFGSEEHAQKWEEILRLCSEKGIPFYILTSGNKVGIIRMLQLLELADCVTEVLCNNSSKRANPTIENRTFDRMNKYQIIEHIIRVISTGQGEYRGIFIDNDERNKDGHELCPNIIFLHANGVKIQKNIDYEPTSFMTYVFGLSRHPTLNYFFDTEVINHMYIKNTNLVDTRILDSIIEKLKSGETNIIFADFDGTMSPWGGALPFHLQIFNIYFNRQFEVVESPL